MNLFTVNYQTISNTSNKKQQNIQKLKQQSSIVNFNGYPTPNVQAHVTCFAKKIHKGDEKAIEEVVQETMGRINKIIGKYQNDVYIDRVEELDPKTGSKLDYWAFGYRDIPSKDLLCTTKFPIICNREDMGDYIETHYWLNDVYQIQEYIMKKIGELKVQYEKQGKDTSMLTDIINQLSENNRTKVPFYSKDMSNLYFQQT